MKTIVCPTDFSPCSANAAIYAAEMAKEFNSRLILVHVYNGALIYSEDPVITMENIDKTIRSTAEKNINKLKDELLHENKRLRISTLIKEGNEAEEICSLASQEDADAIIMGTTGKGKAKRMLIGSTSAKVISRAQCPVLLIPKGKKYASLKKIVFATNLNEDNLNAAHLIISFAKHFKSEIIFVFVDDKHLLHSEENIAEMTKKIRTHVKYSKMSGYVANNTSITGGIDYFLKKHPADLLVMFTHERHFPKTLVKPSVTRKMSQHVHIPLLALPVEAHTLAGAE